LMFAFFPMRFAAIRDCFSLVSMMIGIFGLGQVGSFWGFVFEKMFSNLEFTRDSCCSLFAVRWSRLGSIV